MSCPAQYKPIAAVAGRSLDDHDLKLSPFAVGDGERNIYALNGASIAFTRTFEGDDKARLAFLVGNYRSTRHIIGAANSVIAVGQDRKRADHAIRINAAGRALPAGNVLLPPAAAPTGVSDISEAALPYSALAAAVAATLQGERRGG